METASVAPVEAKKRNLSFDLLRIIAMAMIILCHLASHGTAEFATKSANYVISELFKYGGALGNNLFILISGYFMIKSSFRWEKVLRLFLEVTFYSGALYLLYAICGGDFSAKHLIQSFLPFLSGGGYWFIVTYMLLYFLSPLLNAGIKTISQKQFGVILIVFLTVYWFVPSVIHQFISVNDFGYSKLAWMILVYGIGAWIRLYTESVKERRKWYILLLIPAVLVMLGSGILKKLELIPAENSVGKLLNVIVDILSDKDMCNIMPFLTALLLFLIFRSIKIEKAGWLLTAGSATFGVYLLHNHVWFMDILWFKWLRIPSFQNTPYFLPYSLAVTVVILAVGIAVECLRKKFLEDPLFRLPFMKKIVAFCNEKLQ